MRNDLTVSCSVDARVLFLTDQSRLITAVTDSSVDFKEPVEVAIADVVILATGCFHFRYSHSLQRKYGSCKPTGHADRRFSVRR